MRLVHMQYVLFPVHIVCGLVMSSELQLTFLYEGQVKMNFTLKHQVNVVFWCNALRKKGVLQHV